MGSCHANQTIAILICSYDGSEDLWGPLHDAYDRYWPDNQYSIYLMTNYKDPNLVKFNVIKTGKEKSWTSKVTECINHIGTDYILITFDDLFPCAEFDNKNIEKLVNYSTSNKVNYLRLNNKPKYDRLINADIGVIEKNRLYRTSLVWSIFKADFLKKILYRDENAWEFEIYSSARSNYYDKFFVSTRNITPYLNAVVKGKWARKEYLLLLKDGFLVSDKNIQRMTRIESALYNYVKLRSYLFSVIIPKSKQEAIREFFFK
jgi:hypothetical protein